MNLLRNKCRPIDYEIKVHCPAYKKYLLSPYVEPRKKFMTYHNLSFCVVTCCGKTPTVGQHGSPINRNTHNRSIPICSVLQNITIKANIVLSFFLHFCGLNSIKCIYYKTLSVSPNIACFRRFDRLCQTKY